jgi:hypothetical protein
VSAYDDLVSASSPSLFLADIPGVNQPQNVTQPWAGYTPLPNGDLARWFAGMDRLFIADRPGLSVTDDGFTASAWMMPKQIIPGHFANHEGTGYVHWMGKGNAAQGHEWAFRMYNEANSENRPNRISGYVFGPGPGKGSGAYFEDVDALTAGWINVVMRVAPAHVANRSVHIYRDGTWRRSFVIDPALVLRRGPAPLCIGSRDGLSYFEGAIGKVVIWPRSIGDDLIEAQYQAMVGG